MVLKIKIGLFLLASLLLALVLPWPTQAGPLAQTPPPAFSKVFSPDTIGPGSTSTLEFTIDNTSSGTPVTDTTFTDNLPANVVIATPSSASHTCADGTITAPDGGTVISFSGGEVGGSSSCTVTVNVTSSTAGTHVNNSSVLTSYMNTHNAASANLVVDANRPGFSKSFLPSAVFLGGRSTLTFLFDNSANASQAIFMAFSDNLPTGLEIADPANIVDNCIDSPFTGGIVTAVPGTSVVSLAANAAVAAGGTCTVTVDVVTTGIGQLDNVSNDGTFIIGTTQYNMGKATAALSVTHSIVALEKSFSDDPAAPGSTTPLRFTLTNFDRINPASSIGFTDDLDATLSGMTLVSNIGSVCGGGSVTGAGMGLLTFSGGTLAANNAVPPPGICTFTVTLNIPPGAAAGAYPNTTSNVTSNSGTHNPASDKLFVEPAPILTKSFTDDPVVSGGTVTLVFTVTNPSPTSAMTAINFSDSLPPILQTMFSASVSNSCGGTATFTQLIDPPPPNNVIPAHVDLTGGSLAAGASCVVSLVLNVNNDATSGSYTNTSDQPTATVGGITYSGNVATDDLVVVGAPEFRKYFADIVVPGGTVDLVFELDHSANAPADATAIAFTDDLSLMGITGLTIASTQSACGGSMSSGAGPTFSFSGGSLAVGATCLITVTLQVPTSTVSSNYTNQAGNVTATVSGLAVTGNNPSDDLTVAGFGFSKTFVGDPVVAGDTIPLVFTLVNSSTVYTASTIYFQDNLGGPLGGGSTLVGLASTSGTLTDPCGTGSQLSGTIFLTFSGGSLAPGASCTFTVTLQVPAGAASGIYNNTTNLFKATINGSSRNLADATDALTVDNETLALAKSFVPNSAFVGVSGTPTTTTTLFFTITNISTSFSGTNITFTDDFGAVVTDVTTVGLPLTNVCGTGTVTDSGNANLTFTGGQVAAGASCTFSVTLTISSTALPGIHTNLSSDASGTMSGQPVTGPAASADLTLVDGSTSGQLLVDKVTDPAGDSTSFSFAVKGPALFTDQNFNLADGDTPQVIAAPVGVYTVTETVPTSWTLTSATCSDGSAIDNINISASEVVTCTFNNRDDSIGTIVVDKVTIPAGYTSTFAFTMTDGVGSVIQTFSLSDTSTPLGFDVTAGTYAITETIPMSWTLTSSCSDGSPINNITLSGNEIITCTFTNHYFSGYVYLPIILKDALPLPDLTVDSVVLSQVSGNTYNIAVTVRNQASVDVASGNNFYINAYLSSDLSTPIVVCSVQGGWFGAGQSYICNGQYTFGSGTHTVRGWADPYNTVGEANESNNTRDAGGVTISGLGQSLENKVTYPTGVLPTATPVK